MPCEDETRNRIGPLSIPGLRKKTNQLRLVRAGNWPSGAGQGHKSHTRRLTALLGVVIAHCISEYQWTVSNGGVGR